MNDGSVGSPQLDSVSLGFSHPISSYRKVFFTWINSHLDSFQNAIVMEDFSMPENWTHEQRYIYSLAVFENDKRMYRASFIWIDSSGLTANTSFERISKLDSYTNSAYNNMNRYLTKSGKLVSACESDTFFQNDLLIISKFGSKKTQISIYDPELAYLLLLRNSGDNDLIKLIESAYALFFKSDVGIPFSSFSIPAYPKIELCPVPYFEETKTPSSIARD
jgi:hypothetical protein